MTKMAKIDSLSIFKTAEKPSIAHLREYYPLSGELHGFCFRIILLSVICSRAMLHFIRPNCTTRNIGNLRIGYLRDIYTLTICIRLGGVGGVVGGAVVVVGGAVVVVGGAVVVVGGAVVVVGGAVVVVGGAVVVVGGAVVVVGGAVVVVGGAVVVVGRGVVVGSGVVVGGAVVVGAVNKR